MDNALNRTTGYILAVLLGSFLSALPAIAQEEVTSFQVRIQSIPGCIDLTYPTDKPNEKVYTDTHHLGAARPAARVGGGGGMIGELQTKVTDPMNSMDKSRDGAHHTEQKLTDVGYQPGAAAGGAKTLTRNFTIRRHATFKFCVRPSPALGLAGGPSVTFNTRMIDLKVSVRVDPGKPANQYITKETADAIDRENRQFKQNVDQAIAALTEEIKKRRDPLEPNEAGQLFTRQGVAKVVKLNFANTPYETTVKLRRYEEKAR